MDNGCCDVHHLDGTSRRRGEGRSPPPKVPASAGVGGGGRIKAECGRSFHEGGGRRGARCWGLLDDRDGRRGARGSRRWAGHHRDGHVCVPRDKNGVGHRRVAAMPASAATAMRSDSTARQTPSHRGTKNQRRVDTIPSALPLTKAQCYAARAHRAHRWQLERATPPPHDTRRPTRLSTLALALGAVHHAGGPRSTSDAQPASRGT